MNAFWVGGLWKRVFLLPGEGRLWPRKVAVWAQTGGVANRARMRTTLAGCRITLDCQQGKGSRQHRRPTPSSGRRRAELRGNEEDAMIRRVKPHIARSLRSRHAFDNVILVGRVLVNHRERAIGIRGERVA